MKKVIYQQFGDESVLELAEQPVPTPEKDQLLIRVKAASINPLDWKVYGGEMKLMSGSKFPKSAGIDFAGVVEGVGAGVSGYKVGDEVMGLLDAFKGGALAEYVVVREANVSRKPAHLSFEKAAALPVTGLSALQIVEKLAAISKNQDVLINGATGGIGLFAIQMAKKRGARVTAVAGAEGVARAAEWGADTVIDYSKQDPLHIDQRYDAVIDLSTKMSFKPAKKILKKKGHFVTTLATPLALLHSLLNNIFSPQKLQVLILKPTPENLKKLTRLAETDLQVVLDKTYPINEVRRAYKEARQGKIVGKSVIIVS